MTLDEKAKAQVPTWTAADMHAALRQGWMVFAEGECANTDHYESVIEYLRFPEGWADYAQTPRHRIKILRTDRGAITAARKAAARGEVHAIKAWMHLLAHSPSWAAEHNLSEWELPT